MRSRPGCRSGSAAGPRPGRPWRSSAMTYGLPGTAEDVLGRDAEHPAERLVDVGQPALAVAARDHVLLGIEQIAIAGLALAQLPDHVLQFLDAAVDAVGNSGAIGVGGRCSRAGRQQPPMVAARSAKPRKVSAWHSESSAGSRNRPRRVSASPIRAVHGTSRAIACAPPSRCRQTSRIRPASRLAQRITYLPECLLPQGH